MLSSSRPNGRRLLNKSLGLLAVAGMGLGAVAMTGGTAYAALSNRGGGNVPLSIQGGRVSLPDSANSVLVTIPGTGAFCTGRPGDRSANISTGLQVGEGTSFSIDAFSDGSCRGNKVSPGIGYTASYNGPSPKNGTFTLVQVRITNPAMFVCTDGGWTDGLGAGCRQA
ncbi:hypothetical protein [Streptomyces acidiscabies]|uniref:hypothetical protein n=1 Tax=Streptomyces acidiscabies TaxID=42234 RepID=UPI000951496F|nr:hypothetical protein [Streptomyces acidiscabies]GAV44531.1 hypothetical protein Saa2_07501 [Streptomyces acidiscabies]